MYDSVKAMPNKVVHDQATVQVELKLYHSKSSYTSSESIIENGSGDPIKDLDSKAGNLRTRSLEAAVLHSSNAISPNSVLYVIIYTLKALLTTNNTISNYLLISLEIYCQSCKARLAHTKVRLCWDL